MRNNDSLSFIARRARGIVSAAKSSLLERRKAIEADAAQRRGRLLEADRMLLQLPKQAEQIRAVREPLVSTPIGTLLDRNSVLDDGATKTLGHGRRTIEALDELLADVPAALEFWKARRKELA
jgi:hypothetical protein